MKTKQFLTLIVVAAVVVVIGVFVVRSRNEAWQGAETGPGGDVLPDFPINDVASLKITGADSSVTIAHKDDRWVVEERYNYPANYETLRTALIDLDELRAAQEVKVGESQYGRLDLAAPGGDASSGVGTEVTFKGADGKVIEKVIFGKEHERKSDQPAGPMGGGGSWPDGRYLRLPDSGRVVLVSKTFTSMEPDPSRWIDKEFFKIGDMKEAWLTDGGKEVWRVSRETKTGNLSLAGDVPEGKEVDSSKLSSIKNAFSWASFSDIADPSLSPEETGMDAPKVYTARTFDDFVYTVRIGKETDDGKYYLQASVDYDGPKERTAAEDESPEDKQKNDDEFKKTQKENVEKARETSKRLEGWTYIVTKYTVEGVIRDRDALLKDKPKPAEDEAAEKDKAAGAKNDAKAAPPPPPPPPVPAAKAETKENTPAREPAGDGADTKADDKDKPAQ